jgi:hypothetical protein
MFPGFFRKAMVDDRCNDLKPVTCTVLDCIYGDLFNYKLPSDSAYNVCPLKFELEQSRRKMYNRVSVFTEDIFNSVFGGSLTGGGCGSNVLIANMELRKCDRVTISFQIEFYISSSD